MSISLNPAEAAVLETFVVPRYLGKFADLALDMLLAGEVANIALLGCRTGHPAVKLLEKIPMATVVGVDESAAAIELARNKSASRGDNIEYVVAPAHDSSLHGDAFSHALSIHPNASAEQRAALFREMNRLLYSGGQALVALPLRGSFAEIGDLFREYALKYDKGLFAKAVEDGFNAIPTIETLSEELEVAGLVDVDVEIRQTDLSFDSGRAYGEDPVTRQMIVPALAAFIPDIDLEAPVAYVRDAIDRYWSDSKFELALNIGCASARKP